jgi:hypothetical protein
MTNLQKTKARLERAKLVVVAARERAVEMTQQSAEPHLTMRLYRASEASLEEIEREVLRGAFP